MATRNSGTRAKRPAARTRPANLSLDAEAMRRGEAFSKLSGTSLSRLVSDFLRGLPGPEEASPFTPAVARLFGVAARARVDAQTHRAHLRKKYGS